LGVLSVISGQKPIIQSFDYRPLHWRKHVKIRISREVNLAVAQPFRNPVEVHVLSQEQCAVGMTQVAESHWRQTGPCTDPLGVSIRDVVRIEVAAIAVGEHEILLASEAALAPKLGEPVLPEDICRCLR
jgi:hypothetical protein